MTNQTEQMDLGERDPLRRSINSLGELQASRQLSRPEGRIGFPALVVDDGTGSSEDLGATTVRIGRPTAVAPRRGATLDHLRNVAEAYRLERGIATSIDPSPGAAVYRHLLAHALPLDISPRRDFADTKADLERLIGEVRAQAGG